MHLAKISSVFAIAFVIPPLEHIPYKRIYNCRLQTLCVLFFRIKQTGMYLQANQEGKFMILAQLQQHLFFILHVLLLFFILGCKVSTQFAYSWVKLLLFKNTVLLHLFVSYQCHLAALSLTL